MAFVKDPLLLAYIHSSVLQCTSFIPEARAVLDLVDLCPDQIQKGRFPVIVIEGLDATGMKISLFSWKQRHLLIDHLQEWANVPATLNSRFAWWVSDKVML